MKDFSYITNSDPAYIENLYKDFVKDPESVDPDFKKFFEGFDFAIANSKPYVNGTAGNGVAESKDAPRAYTTTDGVDWKKELGAYRLILGYRNKGHLIADTNPIRVRKDRGANLNLAFFGFTEEDMDKNFFAGNLIGLGTTSLRKILEHLKSCYAGHVGIEFKYISDQKKVDWLTTEMEKNFIQPLPLSKKERILEKLNQGVMFEKFLHTKYIGQKRFSLEGGETTIPALDAIINKVAEFGTQEVVIGMAHRGRLNVLVNILGKAPSELFDEFEGRVTYVGSADVKYHQGFSSNVMTSGGEVHLALAFNPSHLEIVSPVVEGSVRARQDRRGDLVREQVVPIVMHGDAAFAGQGSRFFELYCGQTGEDSYLATFEIHPELECSNDEHREFTAQEKIHAFCDSIAELQETALDVWKRATRRVIDLGYRCDDRCAAFHELLSVDTLRRMESLGIELALTIYPQEIRLQDEPCEAGGAKLAE